MDTLLCTIIPALICFVVFGIPLINTLSEEFYSSRARQNHKPNHPGITEHTLLGKKDIVCPKCKCPYCTYDFEYSSTPPKIHLKTKLHLLNPFKPLVEDVTTIYPEEIKMKTRYECLNCGFNFK